MCFLIFSTEVFPQVLVLCPTTIPELSLLQNSLSFKCKQCKAPHLKLLPSLKQIEAYRFSKVLNQSLWVLISIKR